jgi:hypothetical protein
MAWKQKIINENSIRHWANSMATKKENKQKTTNSRKRTQIPPPPGPNDSCEVIDDYFSKYSFKDLDEAGHTRQLNKAEIAWVGKLTAAAKENIATRNSRAQLNLALPIEQLTRFTEYAKKKHIPPSTLARGWVLERLDAECKGVL